MLGVAADGSGDSEGEEVGGAGGEFPVAGEAAGDTDDGDGDNALLGGVATGVWVGDKAGDEAGDWAMVELNNNAATIIRT